MYRMWWLWSLGIGCDSYDIFSRQCPEGFASVPKENPEFCVQPFEATITDVGTALSQNGNIPDVNVSFVAAQEACQNTILDGRSLRVINHTEWKRAGGNRTYPWGETHEERCALDSPKMHGVWKDIQPSGSEMQVLENLYNVLKECIEEASSSVLRANAHFYLACANPPQRAKVGLIIRGVNKVHSGGSFSAQC